MALQIWVKLAVLALGLLVMVPESTQLNVDHPLFGVVQKLNLEAGPFLGLVISGGRHERLLKNSTYFTPLDSNSVLTFSGRTFTIGKFNGVPAIYVLAGAPTVNVGVTVQILVDTFRISGLISYGAAATLTNQILIANVVVPSSVAYIGSWTWQGTGDDEIKVVPSLVFGDYNLPAKGDNALGRAFTNAVPIYTQSSTEQEKKFRINVDPEWYAIASKIDFGERPRVVLGDDVVVGTSDVYLNNIAYGQYLNKNLSISAVDTESAAVVTTSIANALPSIVFRGTSNRPGSPSSDSLSDTTAKNVLATVAKFVDAAYNITPKKYSIV